jgi:hypothetical protein
MKYAVLGPRGAIIRVSDTEPETTPEGMSVAQITDEQAATVEAGRTAAPRVFYFVVNGQMLTLAQKREAEILAAMTPEQLALATLRAGLRTAWEATFTEGERAFLRPIYDAAIVAFDAGNVTKAKTIIATAPSITPALDAKRNSILALFPQ